MPALQAIAAVVEKAGSTVIEGAKKGAEEIKKASETSFKEVAKQQLENAKNLGDAVFSKLDEIKNMTPEQLREKMDEVAERYNIEGASKSESGDNDAKHEGLSGSEKAEDAKSKETQELTDDEINDKQKAAIKAALDRIENGEQLSDKELGNLCEMMMDQYYIKLGYKPLHKRVSSLDDPIHQGIDGVYEKDGKFVIVDAKYNKAQLHETKDGRQMSENWINNRLDEAVGKEEADEIRDAMEDDPSSVSTEVYHYDPHPDTNGETHSDVYSVDENGYKCSESTIVETYQNGEPVKDSPEMRN